jgi:hypothetical protein
MQYNPKIRWISLPNYDEQILINILYLQSMLQHCVKLNMMLLVKLNNFYN